MTKGILFDFFGVICSEVAKAWFDKNSLGISYEDFKETYVRPFDGGEVPTVEIWNAFAHLSGKSAAEVKEEWLTLAHVDWEVVSYVKELKTKYQLALCTNSGADFLWSILDTNGLRDLFETTVISSEERVVKPDPRIYQITLQKLGLSPDAVLFIDDRPVNLAGAETLGIRGIQFESLPKLKADLAGFGVSLM